MLYLPCAGITGSCLLQLSLESSVPSKSTIRIYPIPGDAGIYTGPSVDIYSIVEMKLDPSEPSKNQHLPKLLPKKVGETYTPGTHCLVPWGQHLDWGSAAGYSNFCSHVWDGTQSKHIRLYSGDIQQLD